MADHGHFECGCPLNPVSRSQRCREHRWWGCHATDRHIGKECPPCHRERLLSVGLSRQATPTRRPL